MDFFAHKKINVAAVQFPVQGNSSQVLFFEKLESYIQSAKQNKSQLVVFPELLTADVAVRRDDVSEGQQMRALASDFFESYQTWLVQKANEYQIAILGGTTPRVRDDKIVNTALLVFPGNKVFMQDKLFLTPDEKAWEFSAGDELKVFQTPIGKIAVLICFDCEMPQLSQLLAKDRPEIILVPSWTGSMYGFQRVNWTAHARAIEHFAYVIKTSTVAGEGSLDPHFGQAAIITPQDTGFDSNVVVGSMDQPAIIYRELNLQQLQDQRETTGYFPIKEQNESDRLRKLKLVIE